MLFRSRAHNTEYYFAVVLKEKNKVIGEMEAFRNYKMDDETNLQVCLFTICWMLNEPFRGKGYAYEAAHAFFDFDKSTPRPQGRALLNKVAAELVKNAGDVKSIALVGHTDAVGSAEYNQKLSVRRADAVRNYLIEKGVNPSIITATGEGISHTFDNATAEGRSKNRRVDVKISAVREVKVD